MDKKKKKVLLVEDEEVLRESVRDWLTEDGFDVEVAVSGEEALDKVKQEEYGVIVLDLRLPGKDGLQVFEEAKSIRPKTKGVIITAYPSRETKEKAKRLGLLDYLPKPFKVEDLEKLIGSAIEEIEEISLVEKHLWLELGAVSFRLCTRSYQCSACAFAHEIQDRFGTISVVNETDIARYKELPGNQRLCRYASVHFVKKEAA